MKKTSPRKFGKQLKEARTSTGRLRAQDQKKRASALRATSADFLTSHNTPPDVVISEGSLNIESSLPLTGPPSTTTNPPFNYVTQNDQEIGHIRILTDNGDKIYEDLESHGSSLSITWEDDNPGTAATGQLTFVASNEGTDRPFTIVSDKRLGGPPATPPAAHRRFKFSHDGSNPSTPPPGPPPPRTRMRIKSVSVTNPGGMTSTFNAPPPRPTTGPMRGEFFAHEFRVLIWLH